MAYRVSRYTHSPHLNIPRSFKIVIYLILEHIYTGSINPFAWQRMLFAGGAASPRLSGCVSLIRLAAYAVCVWGSVSEAIRLCAPHCSSTEHLLVDDLKPHTMYEFVIQSRTATTQGAFSIPIQCRTLAGCTCCRSYLP